MISQTKVHCTHIALSSSYFRYKLFRIDCLADHSTVAEIRRETIVLLLNYKTQQVGPYIEFQNEPMWVFEKELRKEKAIQL